MIAVAAVAGGGGGVGVGSVTSGIWTPTIENVQINSADVADSVLSIRTANWVGGADAKHFQAYFSLTPPAGSSTVSHATFQMSFPDDIEDISDFWGDAEVFVNMYNASGDYYAGQSGGGSVNVADATDTTPYTRGSVELAFRNWATTSFLKYGVVRGKFIL